MILIGSLALTLIGSIAVFVFEYSNLQTIGNFSLSEKIINSLIDTFVISGNLSLDLRKKGLEKKIKSA